MRLLNDLRTQGNYQPRVTGTAINILMGETTRYRKLARDFSINPGECDCR